MSEPRTRTGTSACAQAGCDVPGQCPHAAAISAQAMREGRFGGDYRVDWRGRVRAPEGAR